MVNQLEVALCLALLLKIKDNKGVQPLDAVAISPWTDLSQSGNTMKINEEIDPIISKKYLDRMAGLYLKDSPFSLPLASPLFGDLSKLPPILIQVGTAETMLDDSKRFFEKAKKVNVDINIEIWKDMFHGWHGNAHILKDAELAIQSIGNFCKKLYFN